MLVDTYVDISITVRNMNYYKDKGYNIPMKYSEKSHKDVVDNGKKIRVKTEDLPPSSHARIKYRCDNCGNIYETDYHSWCNAKSPELGDLCKSCAAKIKLPQIMQSKYGYTNSSQVPSIIEKKKQTNLDKYNNEWSIASDKVRDNILHSYLEKFGTDNPMKDDNVKQRAIETNKEKYGGNSCMCDEKVKNKSKQTCLQRYGVPNAFQSKDIQAKARETLYRNGSTPSSKAEKALCDLLISMFGTSNCFPNYPVGNLSLDCLVLIGNNKFDFEYDGIYWHKDRKQKDAARNAVLMNKGYKIIRIKANNQDLLPTEQQILQAVDYLVKDNHRLTFIDMNN